VDIDAAEIDKLGSLPDLAIRADAKQFLIALLEKTNSLQNQDRADWLRRCQDWKKRYDRCPAGI